MILKEDATYWLIDQQSANGTIVNDQPVGKFQLSDGDLIKIGSSVLKFVCGSSMDASVFDELHRRAVRDSLTGAYNRAYFDKSLNQELSRAKRHEPSVSPSSISTFSKGERHLRSPRRRHRVDYTYSIASRKPPC